MSLMDILNGMQNGPRGGGRQPSGQGTGSGGGMSPMTMALMALLAYKAIKSFSGTGAGAPPAQAPSAGASPAGLGFDEILKGRPGGGQMPGQMPGQAQAGGGLGGVLAGLAGGAGLGSLVSGGLGDLLEQFKAAGKGDAANSWIGPGENQAIAPHELSQVLGPEQVDFLSQRTGLAREDLLAGLSEQLPQLVDRLTPDGRLPTADEMSRTV
jgi:uncharacterized protein YidB (DUF937 family)